jgi:outer membrane lipopolysaccharide assembly protein LptE/RlpB
MVTSVTPFNTSLLLNYYQAQAATASASQTSSANSTSSSSVLTSPNSATAKDDPPWDDFNTPPAEVEAAQVLDTTNFINTSNVPLTAGSTLDSKTEQDNQKLFSLYTAINNLSYLAKLAQSSTATAGQLEGYNTRFQNGLQQVQSYLSSTSFNNFTLQASATSSSVTSTATVPLPSFTYNTNTLVSGTNVDNALPNVSSSDSFNIAVKKNGVTTQVPIDLSQVQDTLSLGNIVSYANQQLSAAGFSTRLQKVITSGSDEDLTTASYGLQLTPGANETVSFSAASQPALYLVGSTGSPTDTTTTSSSTGTITNNAADQQGRIVKLSDLDSNPQSVFSANVTPTSGTTNAQATAVDSSGNIYVIGNATGDFGSQINQGSQDTYLTKYDSAGNVQWTQLLGSAGSASGYSLTLDSSGNPIVVGSTTSDLTQTAIANGNNDSFVSKYDSSGDQLWTQQLQTLNANQANTVTTDASGNIYIGGQVTGVIAAGQTSSGGTDGYVAKLNSSGTVQYEQQLGTSGSDTVSATTTGSDGSLYVASVQNGEAVVSKYANGDATTAPVWTQDLGALQNGGTIGGLVVSGNQVYLSGTTTNGNLTAGGAATVASAASGGSDAYVFNLTDNGSSATANTVSYVGTGAQDQGGSLTVGSDGTVYLAGTTSGTFANNTRNVAGTNNAFVAAIGSGGAVNWVRQYGGVDGQSAGTAVAVDPNGASVLDALGLPTGTVNINQSVDLTTATTLRAGDSFQLKIANAASSRTATITIDSGETLNSLTTKINAELGGNGKASVSYASGGEGLKIAVNSGVSATLISGPAASDALGRLGISPGVITNAATTSSTSSSTTASTTTSATSQAFGLGLTNNIDLSTAIDAGAARAELMTVMSSIQNIYQTTNTPASSTSAASTSSSSSGTTPAYLTAQIANYNAALSILTASSSSSSTSSSTSSSLA